MSNNELIKPKEGIFKKFYLGIQRKRIEKIVEKTGQLLPAFQATYKSGNIGLFSEFIKQYHLEEVFLEDSLDDFMKIDNEKQKKCFINIVENMGISYLGTVYGEKVGEKLQDLYKRKKINFFDIKQLVTINKKDNIEQQAEIIGKILDLCGDDTLEVGIHRTGGWTDSGKTINDSGLILTGHISSGVDSRDFTHVKDKLEENISFFNNPGLIIQQIAVGGRYKNYLRRGLVDIAIIAIPKEELEKANQSIILKHGNQLVLDPKFVKGYVTVDSENETMKQYVENPKSIIKVKNPDFKTKIQPEKLPNTNNLKMQSTDKNPIKEDEIR